MRRILVLALVALLAGAAIAGAAAQSHAKLKQFVCQRALDPAARAVSTTAVMRPVHDTRRMAMRFELLRRSRRGGTWTEVSGGDLGTWVAPSDPTLGSRPGDVWILKHPVVNLPVAPALYRFRVSFRWTGTHGKAISRAQLESPECFQPELRPDLRVISIVVRQGKPNAESYTAEIRNAGATGAGPFDVELVYGPAQNQTVKHHTIKYLGPHQKRHVTFLGPVCTTSGAPVVTVDPTHQVDDYNTANNSRAATCQ